MISKLRNIVAKKNYFFNKKFLQQIWHTEYFVNNKQAIISAQVLIKNIKKKLEGNNVVAFQKFIFSLLITNIIIKNRNETEDDDLLMKNA